MIIKRLIKHYRMIVFSLLALIAFEIGFISTLFVTPTQFVSNFSNFKVGKGSLPKAFIVQSGSMEPSIKTGSIVFSIPQNNYRVGEVVTFSPTGSKKNLVTHRIVSVGEAGELTTKGDANEDADTQTISAEKIVGRTIFSIPYLGYIANFAKNPKGFILLVVVPATIVIYEEMKNLRKEIGKLFAKIKTRLFTRKKKSVYQAFSQDDIFLYTAPLPKTKNVPAYAVAVPVLGVLLVLVAFSASYFSDREKSTDNILGAAESYGTPTPTIGNGTLTPTPTQTQQGKVVINEVYYDPDADHIQPSTAAENNFEWVEIYNNSGVTVNLKDWRITDATGTERTISTSNRNLNPGQYAILAKAANAFTQWSIPSGAEQIPLGEIIGSGLNNGGDSVILKNDLGTIIDQMSYGDNSSVLNPSVPDVAEGHSVEREPKGTDTDTAADFVDRTVPSPGS